MGGYGMTRENDIINAAWDYFQDLDSHHFHLLPHCNSQTDAFEAGAKWADKTMIEKACKWLEQHKEDYNKYDAWRGEYVDFNELITDFKKKMEE
jgi:hypothetical protein